MMLCFVEIAKISVKSFIKYLTNLQSAQQSINQSFMAELVEGLARERSLFHSSWKRLD